MIYYMRGNRDRDGTTRAPAALCVTPYRGEGMKEHSFAYKFYVSETWRKCRLAYLQKEPLCERCGNPATQVHHKARLTPDNIRDPAIALNFDNLEALCDRCHQQEHRPIRWRCDEMGHVEL